jgi:putative transposase
MPRSRSASRPSSPFTRAATVIAGSRLHLPARTARQSQDGPAPDGHDGVEVAGAAEEVSLLQGPAGRIAPDLIKRQFDAEGANQKWVTDVTEFNVAGEKLYLSPVMDLFNGEIIAFETARRPVFKLVETLLTKAFEGLRCDEKPILHSDQGWHYQMPAYQRRLQTQGVVQSMSRKGNCLDNAAMESFFAILKSEFFHPTKFASVQSLQSGIADYIHYYNNDRIKLKLKGLSPVQYRTQPLNLQSL